MYIKCKCKAVDTMNTVIVSINEIRNDTLHCFVRAAFSSFIPDAYGLARSIRCLTSRFFGPFANCNFTSFDNFTPDSAFDV